MPSTHEDSQGQMETLLRPRVCSTSIDLEALGSPTPGLDIFLDLRKKALALKPDDGHAKENMEAGPSDGQSRPS